MTTLLQTPKRLRRVGAAVLGVCVVLLALDRLFPPPADALHPPASVRVLDRDGVPLRIFLAEDEAWRFAMPTDELPDRLRKAVLAVEDRRYYWHLGVDPLAVARAAVANVRAGRVVQGGSTISMQVARLIEPKERTLPNKVLEALRAVQLEIRYSKEELLTRYLNLAPYGGNLVGVGAASQRMFGKHPEQLSWAEIALLVALPNRPNAYRPDRHPIAARAGRDRILKRLLGAGLITAEEYRLAETEPVPSSLQRMPFVAPHWAEALQRWHPGQARIPSTIDIDLQRTVERLLSAQVAGLRFEGIENAAAVVIENETGDVLASVGSVDFFDEARSGQVNGALAPRSPGSALKPFVYALALDRGVIGPSTLLEDVPVDYAGYQPVNFDETFSGAVPADQALIASLNVPAVNLDNALGPDGLYAFLKRAGVTTLPEDRPYYGLSLVLGGAEVRLMELTNLYAGLARGGSFGSVRLTTDAPVPAQESLLSASAAFVVTDVLKQLRRPELPAVWEWAVDVPTVAWKTGTSYGHRDAWSVGYTPRYTVGVWVGNFDGRGTPALVGVDAAAPVLMRIMQALESQAGSWFGVPASLERRQVCSITGLPATEACPSTRRAYFLPGVTPHHDCDVHRVVQIDRATGHSLCSTCRQGRVFDERSVEYWPARVASWRRANGLDTEPIPAHAPFCPRVGTGEPPTIISPADGAAFKLRAGVDARYQMLRLDATAAAGTAELNWFLDGKLVHRGPPGTPFFIEPTRGTHVLSCTDDQGRTARTRFTVN
ncbi:MAG: penicillin-binding protein 1C [Bacteroidota bacterium]